MGWGALNLVCLQCKLPCHLCPAGYVVLIDHPANKSPCQIALCPFCLQEKRISCVDALFHPFLEDGKMRYHTYLCSCCHTSSNGGRVFARELEPSASFKFDFSYEKELTSIAKARGWSQTLQLRSTFSQLWGSVKVQWGKL